MSEWSFQLYSARNHPPLKSILQLLAEFGYTQVEGFEGLYDESSDLRKDLDRNGLTMPSGHFGLGLLQDQVDDTKQIIDTLGVETVICPYLTEEQRPADAEGWKRMAEVLNKVGENYREDGLVFGWHNHDFEFVLLENGQTPMEILLEYSEMSWEIDLAWVIRGKADPQEWIRRYGERFCAVHLKDIAPAGENTEEDGWADVGHGVIDWPRLNTQLRKTPAQWYVIEHDKPSDVKRFARRSLETVQSFTN